MKNHMSRITSLALLASLVTVMIPAASAQVSEQQPPVYDESADAAADIAAALAAAETKHTRVLIQWGANWCGW